MKTAAWSRKVLIHAICSAVWVLSVAWPLGNRHTIANAKLKMLITKIKNSTLRMRHLNCASHGEKLVLLSQHVPKT
jgi:hypothetical protein